MYIENKWLILMKAFILAILEFAIMRNADCKKSEESSNELCSPDLCVFSDFRGRWMINADSHASSDFNFKSEEEHINSDIYMIDSSFHTSTTEIEKESDTPCICPMIWDPICGEDGKTYSNQCFLRCSGVKMEYRGECRDRD